MSRRKKAAVDVMDHLTYIVQGSYGHGKPGKVMEFLNAHF